jgi:hypothetical protein
MGRWGDRGTGRAKAGKQDIRKIGNQDITERKREMKAVKRDFKIFLLILTMADVGGTSLGQAFTH